MIFERVPGVAAAIDEVGAVPEEAVGEVVVAPELPVVLLGVEFGTRRRQRRIRPVSAALRR
jgi:hypothetical protein